MAEANLRPSYRVDARLPERGGQRLNTEAAYLSTKIARAGLTTGMLCKEKRRCCGTKSEALGS